MSGFLIGPCGVAPSVSTTAPFALDGTPQPGNTSGANLSLPAFSTTYGNDVIVIAMNRHSAVTSITGGGLTFVREPGLTPPTDGTNVMDIWYAIAAAPLSGVVFTLDNSAFTTAIVFAISGAKTTAPFDTNAAIPATTTSGAAATITTTAANTFAFGIHDPVTSVPGTGYTNMTTANFLGLNYKFATVPLSADQCIVNTGDVTVATAIVQGP